MYSVKIYLKRKETCSTFRISVKSNVRHHYFLGARRAPRTKTWVHREKVWVHRAPVHPLISSPGSLKREMARKRRNMLRNGHVLLLQDNAPPYRAGVTMATIEECSLQLLEHPQYSPDLAPSDFFLFHEMKRQLKGRRFEDRDEICAGSREWLLAQSPYFYF